MSDKLYIYRDKSGEYRWRRVASNGQNVSVPGEGFTTKYSAIRSGVRKNKDIVAGNVIDGDKVCTSVLVSRYLSV